MSRSLQLHWFHILLALADKPQHGVSITQEVLRHSEGRLQLWPGMLYTALRNMTDEGYVVETAVPDGFSAGGGKPRFYRITPLGKTVCAAEAARLARIVGAAHDKRVLKGTRAV
jgi:DNA-binding PadR family transcriptional regulator